MKRSCIILFIVEKYERLKGKKKVNVIITNSIEYASGPKYPKILDMGIKKSATQHAKYVRTCPGRVLNISRVLHLP